MNRHPANPLITPGDVRPSRPGVEVFGVFNAGVTTLGREIVLLLRIAERPVEQPRGKIRTHLLTERRGRLVVSMHTIRRADRRYDVSDRRIIRDAHAPGHPIRFLTSLSHVRLARSSDGIHFRIARTPWLFPAMREEAWGCEDPRVTKIGDTYWINYTAVSDLGIATSLASTRSFASVRRHGVIFSPPNRDVTMFPGKIRGMYAAFHRPMPHDVGEESIWYATSPDLRHWGNHRFVIGPRPGRWDAQKVGGGAPPILTREGWLMITHGVDHRDRYSLGALLTDTNAPWVVRARSRQPVLAPTAPYERRGVFPNVCFTCGALLRGRDLWIYYGAADRVLALATVPLKEMFRHLGVK